ncbi:MAG: hypothetical protein CM15mP120_03190 [Pseudomonadota bacterium]|nr:MAG: hypothetical protein CM15mP120_03190 [Pseudomonadota bacterium]
MSEAGNVDLSQFERWYEQAGTPELRVTEDYQNGVLTLAIEQSFPEHLARKQKHRFICLYCLVCWTLRVQKSIRMNK